MATVALTTLLPEVLPYVTDCPQLLATNAIRNAAIEFCERTRLWTYTPAAISLVASTSAYTPTLPSETVLVEILQAHYDERQLPAKSPDELTRLYRGENWVTKEAEPLYHFREAPSQIRLVPIPNTSEADALELRVALAPSRAGTLIDSEIAERFTEVIAIGARARLHGLAGQPFFNPAEAAREERKFKSLITDARIKANRGYARAPQGVSFNGGFL